MTTDFAELHNEERPLTPTTNESPVAKAIREWQVVKGKFLTYTTFLNSISKSLANENFYIYDGEITDAMRIEMEEGMAAWAQFSDALNGAILGANKLSTRHSNTRSTEYVTHLKKKIQEFRAKEDAENVESMEEPTIP